MANRRWTSSEDAILLSCMEDSDQPLTYAETRMRLPSRTEAAIQDHYRAIRTRELDEDEYTALQTSWQRNRRHMFSRAAAECGLTVDQYTRIAFHASVGLPHMQQDLSIVDCQFVGENYRRNKREIWRSMTRGIDSVSWKQAEKAWHSGHSAFGVRC